jgi:Killing trait.
MAEEQVNTVATDAVTQTNLLVLGTAPAMAMASLYQTLANSLAMASMNAVHAQQQANIAHQAATAQGVALLLSLGKS